MIPPIADPARLEFLGRGDCPPIRDLADGVEIRILVSGDRGARGLSTVTATVLRPGAELPWHTHPFSEALTVVRGRAWVHVERRRYQLGPHDAIHIPADVPHKVVDAQGEAPLVVHLAFADATPRRTFLEGYSPPSEDRTSSGPDCPEHLTRFAEAPAYELAPNTSFRDLFAGRLGSHGICGGVGIFAPGASLPCHIHDYDESITIFDGRAVCQVAGHEYELSDCDTACIPRGRPHRFLNRGDRPMAMIWVYAGDEPDRVLLDPGYCDGSIPLSSDSSAPRDHSS
jgi:quercetin dioxygenase-like cupin family protein